MLTPAAAQDLVDEWFREGGLGPLVPRSAGDLREWQGAVGTQAVRNKDLYLFGRDTLAQLLAPGPPVFVLSVFAHGANSSAWTLWHRRPGLRFCAQVHAGGAYARSEDTAAGMRRLVQAYEQCALVAPEVEGDLVVAWSELRGRSQLEVVEASAAPEITRRAAPGGDAELAALALTLGMEATHLLPQWIALRRRLTVAVERTIADRSSGGLGLTDGRYVQWAVWPEGLQVEASSDAHLDAEPLGFATRSGLRARGWQRPAPPELPNHWQRFDAPIDIDAAVDTLLGAARTLLPDDALPLVPEAHEEPRRGKRLLVVPVFKCGGTFVQEVAEALTMTSPDVDTPVIQLDLMGVLADAHRAAVVFDALDVDAELDDGEIVTVDARELASGDVPTLLRNAASLLDTTLKLAILGRHTVTLGPWLLPGHDVPVYGALASGGFDSLVLVVGRQLEAGHEDVVAHDLIWHLLGSEPHIGGPPAIVVGSAEPQELPRRVVRTVPAEDDGVPAETTAAIWQLATRGEVR